MAIHKKMQSKKRHDAARKLYLRAHMDSLKDAREVVDLICEAVHEERRNSNPPDVYVNGKPALRFDEQGGAEIG